MATEKMRLRSMTTRSLVNKMHGSLTPNEREFILDGCESITRRMRWWPIRRGNLTVFSELSGMEMLLDVLRVWVDDVPVSFCAMRAILGVVRGGQAEADQVLELGGLLVVEKCKAAHADDEDVQRISKQLIRVLSRRSGSLAEREIKLCGFCAVNGVDMERAMDLGRLVNQKGKQRLAPGAGATRKNDIGQLVAKVLHHMRKHTGDCKVANAGLDALTELCREGLDDGGALLEKGAPEVVVAAMAKMPTRYEVQWKGCLAIAFMARRPPLSSSLGKHHAVAALKAAYEAFGEDREIRQQALWALEAMTFVEDNVARMKRDRVYCCVYDVLQKHRDRTVLPQHKVALPLGLRAIWTDKQLQEQIYSLVKQPPPPVKKKQAFSSTTMRTKAKYGKVGDDSILGKQGLLD